MIAVLATATVVSVLAGLPAGPAPAAEPGEIRITEWMYDGAGGEWVELTNVGSTAVDLDGWTYDDDSANPAVGFDLSPLGVVEAGESVVFVESDAAAFRTAWGLGADVAVLGGYTNNLGRADQINVFDGSDTLVDRLTYGDQTVGGPRTSGASAWVSEAGLGANDATQWTLSTVGDAEGSVASTGGPVGSPGRSTLAGEPVPGEVRITEWMYDGAGGEWVELTNVGGSPVDLAGWTYDDDSANPAVGFDLSGLGVVEAGESVVFVESDAEAFRTTWGLCAGVGVLGGYTNNLGRADQINVFDGSDELVDRLTYGDQTVGGPRTSGASAWVSAEGLGADDATEWTLSTVGDAEGSAASTAGPVGSPGRSTRATVEHESCTAGPGAALAFDRPIVVGSIGDPTNPTATLTVTPGTPDVAVEDVTVTVASSNPAVLPAAGVTVTGTGAERTIAFAPTGRGTTTLTFTAEEPGGATSSAILAYAASNQAPDPGGRYLHGVSDASSALDVGDGHVLIANDETNTLFLYDLGTTGAPVKTWTFTSTQMGTTSEVDIEGVARSGDTLVWIGSHGNNRDGEVREERRTMFATTITGSGAATELTFAGRYSSLWEQLIDWDETDGHGLGADALGLAAAAAPGVLPNAPDGFNLEGFELAPDGTTGYLGFRGPTVDEEGVELALVVPVTNILDLNDGLPGTTPATFGAPILLDLGGRSIRELRRNDAGDYLISAGPSPSNPTWALYAWDGDPAHAAAFVVDLPAEDLLTGGTWESIATVPHPIAAGATAVLVTDSGDTNLYGTGQTKDLAPLYQKSYVQPIALADPETAGEAPVAEAGPGQDVVEGDTVTLDGTGSSDPEGAALTFAWTQTAGPEVILTGATTATPTFTAPEGPVTLTFSLTVTDAEGLTGTDAVEVVVAGRPTADAGPDQVVDPGDTVTLDGTGSTNPGAGALRYQWTQTYGPAVTLTGATTATPTFTAPAGAAELRFRLIARDPSGRFATDFVHVVVDGPPPTASAGTDRTVEAGTVVALSGGTPVAGLRYRWNQTAGPAVALSGAGSADVTFTAPSSSAELRFRLIVQDQRGRAATDFVTVAVDGPPPTASAGPDQAVTGGQVVTLDAGASTPGKYKWTQTYGPAVTLRGATTATPTFVAPAGPAQVRFRLIVRDGRGRFATDFVHVDVSAMP